jgi:hypothetical protein
MDATVADFVRDDAFLPIRPRRREKRSHLVDIRGFVRKNVAASTWSSTHMFYAGDGHNHWHVYRLQRFEICRLDAAGDVAELKCEVPRPAFASLTIPSTT